jgi:hypothetical protein
MPEKGDSATAKCDRDQFTLRVSVRVKGREPITGLEAETTVMVGPITVTVKQCWPYLIIVARDFDSESDAEAFLDRIKSGLWNLAIEHHVAFNPNFEPQGIARPDNPFELASIFPKPLEDPVTPIHGLSSEDGYTIFRREENIRFFGSGSVTVHESVGWRGAESAL